MSTVTQDQATQTATGKVLLELSNVTVSSATDVERTVVEGLDWSVREGDLWIIAGLQGSGKSGLMALLAGLTSPKSGSYQLMGLEMPIGEEEELPERMKLASVFEQQAGLLHQLTLRENIALPLTYHGEVSFEEIDRRTQHILELTGLVEHADEYPQRISRHWRKRGALARALILEPEIILFDVPLTGLDPRDAAWWMDFIRQLHTGEVFKGKPGVTMVITVDDLRPWRNLDCEFGLLNQKQFLKLGRSPEWMDSPDPLIRELLAEQPVLGGETTFYRKKTLG